MTPLFLQIIGKALLGKQSFKQIRPNQKISELTNKASDVFKIGEVW